MRTPQILTHQAIQAHGLDEVKVRHGDGFDGPVPAGARRGEVATDCDDDDRVCVKGVPAWPLQVDATGMSCSACLTVPRRTGPTAGCRSPGLHDGAEAVRGQRRRLVGNLRSHLRGGTHVHPGGHHPQAQAPCCLPQGGRAAPPILPLPHARPHTFKTHQPVLVQQAAPLEAAEQRHDTHADDRGYP